MNLIIICSCNVSAEKIDVDWLNSSSCDCKRILHPGRSSKFHFEKRWYVL